MAGEGVMLVPPFEPGTVAVATVRGVEGVCVMRSRGTMGAAWMSDRSIRGTTLHFDSDVTDIRPLVVLDLGVGGAKELADYLSGVDMHLSVGDRAAIARQIRRQVKPPRIPEPGLWGVVEAGHKHLDGERAEFVRIPPSNGAKPKARWFDSSWESDFSEWDDLIDPVLVREGVSE